MNSPWKCLKITDPQNPSCSSHTVAKYSQWLSQEQISIMYLSMLGQEMIMIEEDNVDKALQIINKREEEEEGQDDTDEQIFKSIPLQYHAVFSGHSKLVSGIAVDPKGSRMVSGGYDYQVKLWDFNMMDPTLKYFRELEEPVGNYPVHQIGFSIGGDKFCVVHAGLKPKLFTREGALLAEFNKGDQYLADQSQTKGHTASVLGLQWHPTNKGFLITCGMDSTVRIWDINACANTQAQVIKTRNSKGTKTPATTCCYNAAGTYIGAGCLDGSIQFWKEKGPYNKPHVSNLQAHRPNATISSINFSKDGNTIVTRAMDHTLKVWDKRKIKDAVQVYSELFNNYEFTDAIFSPDDRYIVTGVSKDKQDSNSKGSILFIDKQTLAVAKEVPMDTSVVRVVWHAALDQLFLGCTDHKIHGFYRKPPEGQAGRGIAMSMGRDVRRKNIDQYAPNPYIVTPLSHGPMRKRLREKEEAEREREKQGPAPPVKGKGKSGKLGTNEKFFMMKELGIRTHVHEDPREALLKYADAAENAPYFIAPAYAETQPQAILDYESVRKEIAKQGNQEEEDEDSADKRFSKKPRLEK